MASPSYTYTLTNGTTADASQVMQDFNDILNGVTDGTKDLSISALTVAGTSTHNGSVNLGNSSSDDLTITASLASTIAIKTTNSYDIGSSTLGLRAAYFGANSQTVKLQGSSSMSATWTFTFPVSAGTDNYVLKTDGSGNTAWEVGGLIGVQVFTSDGTYTKNAAASYIKVTVVGGGGGGGGSASTSTSEATVPTAGGGGATAIKIIANGSVGSTETVTVGTGGAGGTAGNNAGSSGGTSSFGSHCSCTGGGAGAGSAASTTTGGQAGSSGGTATGGDINISGGYSTRSRREGSGLLSEFSLPGQSLYSLMVASIQSGNGLDATGYGGGGSVGANTPSQSARAGGDGSGGIVIVEEYA